MTKYHSIRQHVEEKLISIAHIPGDQNAADGMTKCLGLSKYTQFLQMLKNGGVLKPRFVSGATAQQGADA